MNRDLDEALTAVFNNEADPYYKPRKPKGGEKGTEKGEGRGGGGGKGRGKTKGKATAYVDGFNGDPRVKFAVK